MYSFQVQREETADGHTVRVYLMEETDSGLVLPVEVWSRSRLGVSSLQYNDAFGHTDPSPAKAVSYEAADVDQLFRVFSDAMLETQHELGEVVALGLDMVDSLRPKVNIQDDVERLYAMLDE
ncbi:MAG TPA: hypothetical protein VLE72_03525 [Candidatus Saccharimonadales bacterium]|nr:hypothetical protein [Candidatus Saccharimonadales bacterium]